MLQKVYYLKNAQNIHFSQHSFEPKFTTINSCKQTETNMALCTITSGKDTKTASISTSTQYNNS